MGDDFELLREYAEQGSERAFRELVERHGAMVYGTALRVLGDASLAEEATQAAFVVLARKARSLSGRVVVAGWLYRTARFVALEARRAEQRRRQHLDQFTAMNDSPDRIWEKISPVLDDALGALRDTERDAVVLRFFEGKSFAQVAETLGTTEAAAKMRVGRALEKMRSALEREGVAVSVVTLAAVLAAHGAPSLPPALAGTISAFAGPGTANTSVTTLVKGALTMMAWNKIRNGALAAILVLLLAGGGTFIALKLKHYHGHGAALTVSTFEPMAGEWAGTFVMSGDGFAEPLKHDAALSIRTGQAGRSCNIEMRVLAPGGGAERVYRFTHSLAGRGDRIVTLDDPTIARPLGEGIVTASAHGPGAGEWRAGFHAAIPNGGGATECQWSRKGDELIIVRRDRHERPNGPGEVVSELHLRRVGDSASPL